MVQLQLPAFARPKTLYVILKDKQMVKRFYITILFFMFNQLLFRQNISILNDSIATYFDEIKTEANQHQQLWGRDLYGPILLVNPGSRQILANFSDSAGVLKQDEKIYSGILPDKINIANTAVDWNGRRWAMVMLPLPNDKTG